MRSALSAVAAAALVAVLVPAGAQAAVPGAAGVDVSYPNCGTLPTGGDFAVVGVNAGVGTTTNPCFADQRAWAATLPGTVHSTADVYLNTQNAEPPAPAAWWPGSDATRRGRAVRSPYGACSGGATRACAWVYGVSIADDDVQTRGVTGTVGRWWLDVETANTWGPSATRNRAVLEGMATTLVAYGQRVGLYSPTNEFPSLIGAVPASSSLFSLPSWISHAADRAHALRLCTTAPLTAGRLLLVQWRDTAARVDRDVACSALAPTPKPKVAGSLRSGAKLTAVAGRWGPGKVALAYRWTRDGVAITGATKKTYTPKAADRRHRIAVVVTGTETGYSRTVRTSAAHRIAS